MRRSDSDERPHSAHFENVTGTERRVPSWLAAPGRRELEREPVAPPPPPLPRELAPEAPARPSRSPAPSPAATDAPERTSFRPSLRGVELEALQAQRTLLQESVDRAGEQIQRAVHQLGLATIEINARAADAAVALAIALARRVIGKQVAADPSVAVPLVREALESLTLRDQVIVRIGAGFAESAELLKRQVSGGVRVEVYVDAELGPYDCWVETELGSVDESIETRFRTLLESLDLAGGE